MDTLYQADVHSLVWTAYWPIQKGASMVLLNGHGLAKKGLHIGWWVGAAHWRKLRERQRTAAQLLLPFVA